MVRDKVRGARRGRQRGVQTRWVAGWENRMVRMGVERGVVLEKRYGEEDDRNAGDERWMYQIADNEEKG
ncbi:hypothetical protein [Saliphagus infecundisoli]|uniref:Uncharacterized protein n=1 Tax=Saliphagus infecundisoli TaxID=1849069 RepID=A0ABD5QMR4_9EURY|nr:hypothetical protein [Saliphagus infecundisoli]